jgi:hypothetical protein
VRLYRKKPVVIEAVVWHGDNLEEVVAFAGDDVFWDVDSQSLKIGTLEGVMTASVHDYIIKGIDGEYYACRPKIFEATYEPLLHL